MKPSRRKKSSASRTASPRGRTVAALPKLSRGKLWAFRCVVALGVPLLFLVVVESILRLAGFGYPTRFLLPSERDGQPVFVQNNRFGWRFFGAARARLPVSFCIPQTRAPDTIRIIVFGGSAAMGDPQPSFGLARMLQAILETRYPHTRFEVVNTAMTAIDSNVVLPIARDCRAANANLWVIYMGNNEVVGPYGAGTVFGGQAPPLPLIRAALALKTTRIGQLINALSQDVHPSSQSEWGGMEMFLNQQIRANDPRMKVVYDHFARNLRDIINAGIDGGARIVVSTVPVNLRDCAPFASEHRLGLTDSQKSQWQSLCQNGVTAEAAGDFDQAEEWFAEAARIDDNFAELRFRQGSCALALGQNAEAERQLSAARDLDTLRFRCDSRLNGLIRETVSNDNDPDVVLADAEHVFAEHSPKGIPGAQFFYDHVHLTFDGNYLLARTIAARLADLLPKDVQAQAAPGSPWPSETDCARRLAWTDWERQQALSAMFSRLIRPPFTGQSDHDAQIQRLKAALVQLAPATDAAGVLAAQSSCENALALAPDDPDLHQQLALLDESAGDLAAALTNGESAVQQLPASAEDWAQLGIILAKRDQYSDAAGAFRRAFQLDPMDVWSMRNLAQSLADLGRTNDAIQEYRHTLAVNAGFGPAWLALGQLLEKTGHKDEAEECYRKALLGKNRVESLPELERLARFCASRGWYTQAATNYAAAIKLDPFDPALAIEAGQNFVKVGNDAEAEQCFSEAATLSPDSMEAHFLYGLELGRHGQATAAAAQFREAVRIMPGLPEARINLGMALEDEGNYSEALAQFDTVLAQDPTNAIALHDAEFLRKKLSR